MGISIVLQISCIAQTKSSSLAMFPPSKSKSRVIFSSKIVFAQIFIPFTAQYCTKCSEKNQSVFKNNLKFLALFVTRIDFHVLTLFCVGRKVRSSDYFLLWQHFRQRTQCNFPFCEVRNAFAVIHCKALHFVGN